MIWTWESHRLHAAAHLLPAPRPIASQRYRYSADSATHCALLCDSLSSLPTTPLPRLPPPSPPQPQPEPTAAAMTTTAAGKPRLRAFAACIECNKAKVKCDGDKPNGTPCTRCIAHTLHCAWAKSKRGRLPGSKNKPKQQQQQQQSSSKEEHEDSSPASPVLHQDFQQQQHQQPPQQQQQQQHQHQQHTQRASTCSYMLDPLPQQPTKRRRVEPQESDLVDYQGRFQAPPQPPMPQPGPSSDMMFWNHNSNNNNTHNQPGATFAHRISRPGSSNSQHPQYHYHQQARYLGHAQMPPPAPMGTSTPSTSAAAVYPARHNPSPSSAADFSRFSSFGHDIGASFNPAFHFELNHLVNTPAMPPPPPQNAPSSSSAAPGAASGAMNQLPIHHAYQHQLHHQMQTAPHASSAQQQQQQQHAQSGLSHFPGSASGRLTPAYPPQYASSSSSQHFVLAPPAPLHPPPLPSPPSAFGPSTSAFSSAPTSTPFPPSSSPPTALGSTRNPVILPPPPAQPNQGRPGSSGGRSMAASSSAPVFLPPHPPPPQLHQGRPGSAGGRSNAAPSPIPRVGSTTPAPSQIQRRPMVTSAVAAAPSSSSPAGTSSMKAVHRAPLELYSPSDPANPLNLLSHAALTSKHDGAGGGGAGRAQGGGGGGGGGSSLGARLGGMRNNGSPRDGSSSASPHSSTYYSRPSSAAARARWGGGGGAGTGAGAAVLDGSAPSSSLAGAVLPPIRDPHLVSRSSSGAGAVPQQGHRAQHVAGSAAEGHWHHDLAARDGIRSHAGRGWQENDEDDERILGRGDRSAAAAVVSRRPNVSADQNNLENRLYPDRYHLSAMDHRRSSLEETSSHTHSHPSRDPNTSSNDTQPRTVLSEQERLRRQRERRKSTQARTLGMLDANAFDEAGPGDDVRGRAAGVKGGRAKARGAKALRQPSSAVRRRDLTRAASAAASSATRRTSPSTLSPSQASSSPSSSSSGAHSPSRSESQSDGEEEEDEDEDDVDEDDDDDDESESGSEAECDASDAFVLGATKLPDSNAGPGPAAGPARDARPGNRTAPSAMDAGARAGMKRSSDDDAAAAGSGGAGGDPSRVKAKHRRKSASAQTKTAGGGGGPTSTRRDAAAAPPTKPITEEEEARVLAAYRSRLAQHGWTESKVADAVEERRDFFSAGIISSGTDVRDVPHVVALGILTEGEVDDLFDFYFRELNTTCAFLDPNLHTPTYVRARSSFLYTVICFAASSVDPRPSSQAKVDRLDKLAREQVLVLNEENARSCEIVQAMLLYNLWALENGTCARDRGSAFVVHAVRMALELGLDVTVKDPTSPEQHTREGRNKLRAFITAVIQDRSLSAFTGRQPVAKLDEYGTGLAEWVDISPVAIPADVEDVGFVTVRLLEQDIRAQLAKTDPSDHVALERVREAANTRMGAWMEQWTTKPILNEAPITRGTMKVVALHVQLVINTVTKSACRDRKADCLRIASELLMIVNTELHDSVQYIPRTIQGMIAWAAVVVIQLTDGDIPSLAIDTALLMAGNANDPYRTRTFARFYGRFLLATIESVHSETMHSSLSCSSRLSELEAGEADARDRPVVSLGDVPNGGGPVGGMEGQAGLADPMEWANDAAAGTNGLNQRGDADQEPSFRPAFENMLPPEVQQQQQSQSHSASSSSTFPTSVNSSAPTSQFSVPLQNSGGESTTMPNDNSGSDANAQHLNIQQAFSLMDGMGSTVSNAYNLCASTTRSYGDEAGHSSTGQQQQQQQQHQQDRQRMHFHGGSHGGHSTVPNGNGGMGNGAFSLVPVPSLGMGGAGFSGFDDNFLLPPGVNWETFLVGDVPLQRRV